MGGLFSSCMNNGKNENNDTNADTKDNSQKQTKSNNKTSKKQKKESRTENTQDPDADKNKQIELSTSVSATQETGSSNTEVKDETIEQKNITQDIVSPKPAAQNPPAPVSVKPIPRYDYVCEFLFDVKADFLDENRYFIVSFGENTHGKKIITQSPIFQTYSRDQDLNTLTNSQMENIVKDIIGSFPEAIDTIEVDYVQLFLCGNMLTGNSLFKDNAIKETDVVKVIVSCL